MKNSYLTVTDQFCGAGGSSQGVRKYSENNGGGIEVKLALNHWKLAIETHNTNFPETIHDCTDISASDPRRYFSTDILITSPECTNHSLAKGKKKITSQLDLFQTGKFDAAAERSRATMWDVPRFAEVHDYNIIITENVVDARSWIMWDAWLLAMQRLGYNHHCCYFNSMHFPPTPQSRDRMYVVFWKKGNKAPDLNYHPKAFCSGCDKEIEAVQSFKNPMKQFGKYRTQYVYRCPKCAAQVEPYYHAAFNCIDWSILGTRIGDRKKPLAANTMKRIEYGEKKYGNQYFVIHTDHTKTDNRVHRMSDTMFTQTTRQVQGIVSPFIIKNFGGKQKPINIKKPLGSITTIDHHGLVGLPFITELTRTGKARGINSALSTIMTSGAHHGICSNESVSAFLSYYYGTSQASGINKPTGTVTTNDRISLVLKPKENHSIEDYTYRMLKAHEIQAAMAFDSDYVIVGNQRDKVKQCGNAVTPPVMEWIIGRCVDILR